MDIAHHFSCSVINHPNNLAMMFRSPCKTHTKSIISTSSLPKWRVTISNKLNKQREISGQAFSKEEHYKVDDEIPRIPLIDRLEHVVVEKERDEKLVEELEGLVEEAIMGEDEGREPNDYHRRAHIFDTCSRVFKSLKEEDSVPVDY